VVSGTQSRRGLDTGRPAQQADQRGAGSSAEASSVAPCLCGGPLCGC